AGDGGIVAIEQRRGHGKAASMERPDHAELAVDRVRGGKQLARWLAPQHVAARGRLQKIGGIGLAALELPHAERSGEIGEPRGEKGFEPGGIDGERIGDRFGAGKRGLAIDRRHDSRLPYNRVKKSSSAFAVASGASSAR